MDADLLRKILQIANTDNNETYDQSTDSLEALRSFLVSMNSGLVNIFKEQITVGVSQNVTDVESDILLLNTPNTRFALRNLRVKCANPGADTVTIRLYEFINGVEILVDTFDITVANFANYFSLMDMFGECQIVGDHIRVAMICSVAGPYAVTGQYNFATAL